MLDSGRGAGEAHVEPQLCILTAQVKAISPYKVVLVAHVDFVRRLTCCGLRVLIWVLAEQIIALPSRKIGSLGSLTMPRTTARLDR